jgi:predicted DNA-binding transcriptional regulator AlpA
MTTHDTPGPDLLGYAQVADLLGVSQATVRKYNSDGFMPAPDQLVLGRPFWRRATITAWQRQRPGRGRWGERKSDQPTRLNGAWR